MKNTVGTVIRDRSALGLAPFEIDVSIVGSLIERVAVSKYGQLAFNLTADQARELALHLTRAADILEPRGLGIGKGVTGFVS